MKRRIALLGITVGLVSSILVGCQETTTDYRTSREDIDVEEEVGKVISFFMDGVDEDNSSRRADNSILSSATTGQKNAYEKAQSYLSYSSFSYEGLIDQLEYEQYSTEEAKWAVDHCGADWREQAVQKGKSYLDYSSFSKEGLREQLEYEKFTAEEADYAVNILFGNSSANSFSSNDSGSSIGKENALEKANDYLRYSSFSYKGLIDQLKYEGFTDEEAKYGVDNCGADWNEQAAKKAQDYLRYSSFSRKELLDQLKYEGFTSSEAEYGVKQVGY